MVNFQSNTGSNSYIELSIYLYFVAVVYLGGKHHNLFSTDHDINVSLSINGCNLNLILFTITLILKNN